jgi:hypothetical protein
MAITRRHGIAVLIGFAASMGLVYGGVTAWLRPGSTDALLLPQSRRTFTTAFRRLLHHHEPNWELWVIKEFSGAHGYYHVVMPDRDYAGLFVDVVASSEQARTAFARTGNQFVQPVLTLERVGEPEESRAAGPPVQFDPPLISHVVVPGLGDENYVWRGYGNNNRGVINLRKGNVIAHVNAPSVDDAQRIAEFVVELVGS